MLLVFAFANLVRNWVKISKTHKEKQIPGIFFLHFHHEEKPLPQIPTRNVDEYLAFILENDIFALKKSFDLYHSIISPDTDFPSSDQLICSCSYS